MTCSFCEAETELLAEGPYVFICERCVAQARSRTGSKVKATCSFCNKPRLIRLENAADDARICRDCTGMAHEIIEHQRKTTSRGT